VPHSQLAFGATAVLLTGVSLGVYVWDFVRELQSDCAALCWTSPDKRWP
jgi:hypothetical protein